MTKLEEAKKRMETAQDIWLNAKTELNAAAERERKTFARYDGERAAYTISLELMLQMARERKEG